MATELSVLSPDTDRTVDEAPSIIEEDFESEDFDDDDTSGHGTIGCAALFENTFRCICRKLQLKRKVKAVDFIVLNCCIHDIG